MKAGWVTEDLNANVRFIDYRGKTPPKRPEGVRLITAKNVKMGVVNQHPEEFVDADAYDGWMTRGFPEEGDVLFTTEAPLGKVAQLSTKEKVIIGQRLITMQPAPTLIDKGFLAYSLMSPQMQEQILMRGTGATVLGIKSKLLKAIPFSYPPLEEQKRIVAVLDGAFEGLDRARTHIQTNLQNARELFERRRVKLFSESESIPAIPLGEVCLSFEYGTSSKSKPTGKMPVLRMGNLQDGELDWEKLVYTDDDAEAKKYELHEGDVLFNRTNSQEHVGKTSIFDGFRPAIFAGYLIRVTPDPQKLTNQYLNHFLNSDVAREYGRSVMGKSVNQANISGSRLKTYPIVLPKLERQREIAAELDELKMSVKQLQSHYRTKLADLDDLRQSLLQKAFAGELT